MSTTVIGFVGLGNMGAIMSARLVEAGFTVHGFDVAVSAREALEVAGGHAFDTLPASVRDADVVILMLPNSDVVEAVLHDPDLVLKDGTVVVDMSSSEPIRTRALAAQLGERGIVLVDAPVSGGVAGARAGTLTIMAGGSVDVLDELEPVFLPIGRSVRAGDVGSGHAIKALNNLLSATHLLSTAEVMVAGERFGLDPQVMLDVFNNSSGQSGSTKNKWPNFVLPDTFNSGFALRLMLKDMRIALGLAQHVGAEESLSSASVELWAAAAQDLPSTADHTEVARWVKYASAPQENR